MAQPEGPAPEQTSDVSPRSASPSPAKVRPDAGQDGCAKFVGLMIFLAGVVMLVLVFFWALGTFKAAEAALVPANPDSAAPLGPQALRAGMKVALLFVMGYVASLIATKGVQLFAASRGVSPR